MARLKSLPEDLVLYQGTTLVGPFCSKIFRGFSPCWLVLSPKLCLVRSEAYGLHTEGKLCTGHGFYIINIVFVAGYSLIVPAPDFSPGKRAFKPARTLRSINSGL
jgi:hypothetical protein